MLKPNTLDPTAHVVINDGTFLYAVHRGWLITTSPDDLRRMTPDEYAEWSADINPVCLRFGSREGIKFCKALINAGAEEWRLEPERLTGNA